jgi:phosphotransferase system  glucose/maltose/N-acetylglucosamine-specific IIC component
MRKLPLILLFLLAIPFVADAQCSMCKAVAESANDGGFGAGLMYLMLFPYLIISGIAYRLYRAKKAAK